MREIIFLQCLFLAAVVLAAYVVAVLVTLKPDSTLNVEVRNKEM